jgi:hypothetical protein
MRCPLCNAALRGRAARARREAADTVFLDTVTVHSLTKELTYHQSVARIFLLSVLIQWIQVDEDGEFACELVLQDEVRFLA